MLAALLTGTRDLEMYGDRRVVNKGHVQGSVCGLIGSTDQSVT